MFKNKGRGYFLHSSSIKRSLTKIFQRGDHRTSVTLLRKGHFFKNLNHKVCVVLTLKKTIPQRVSGVMDRGRGSWVFLNYVLENTSFCNSNTEKGKNLSQLSCQRAHNYHKVFEKIDHLKQFHTICQTFLELVGI